MTHSGAASAAEGATATGSEATAPDPPLRILHVDSERTWRGGQQQILFLLRRQRAWGDEPHLAAPGRAPLFQRAVAEGFPVHAVPMRGTWDLPSSLAIARLHAELRPHVVHWHAARAHALGAVAAALRPGPARVLSRRVVFPVRRSVGSRLVYALPIERIAAISEAVRGALVVSGVNPARIRVVPSGIDASVFQEAIDRDAARQRLGALPGDVVGLTVTALVPAKGVDDLLRAAAVALPRAPNLRLWIAGDGPEWQRLEALRTSLVLGESVRFLGFRGDVPELLQAADFFCLPTHAEGLGSSILEALAAGRPVVATRTGGIPEIVRAQEGVLVPPHDPAALADALVSVASGPETRRAMADQARERAREFDADRTARLTRALYLEAIQVRRGQNRRPERAG